MTTIHIFMVLVALVSVCNCVSTKVDFVEDEKPETASSKEDDMEVKHTIIVTTKLKNNYNRGLHAPGDPEPVLLSRHNKNTKEDSGEVPIVKAFKSVDSTVIRTPDTRFKHQTTRKPVFNINVRDEYDLYPNTGFGSVWKPSNFYNNINYWAHDDFNRARTIRPDTRFINRRIGDDGAREFYCRKCRELSGSGCVQKTNSWFRESTTQKIKVDGKLAKLN